VGGERKGTEGREGREGKERREGNGMDMVPLTLSPGSASDFAAAIYAYYNAHNEAVL